MFGTVRTVRCSNCSLDINCSDCSIIIHCETMALCTMYLRYINFINVRQTVFGRVWNFINLRKNGLLDESQPPKISISIFPPITKRRTHDLAHRVEYKIVYCIQYTGNDSIQCGFGLDTLLSRFEHFEHPTSEQWLFGIRWTLVGDQYTDWYLYVSNCLFCLKDLFFILLQLNLV